MENKRYKVYANVGCLGCLLELLGCIGIFWVLTHIHEITAFLDRLIS